MSKFIVISLTVASFLLSACGWHLRGSNHNAVAIERVSISARDLRSDFVTTLKRTLAAHGIEAVDNGDADYRLTILDQRSKRRTASVSGAARTAEYQLNTEVTLLIQTAATADGVSEPITLRDERYFDFDENRVLASQHEQRELQHTIYENLSRQIVAQLQTIARHRAAPVSNATQG